MPGNIFIKGNKQNLKEKMIVFCFFSNYGGGGSLVKTQPIIHHKNPTKVV